WTAMNPIPQAPAWILESARQAATDVDRELVQGVDVEPEAIEALVHRLEPLAVPGERHHLAWEIGSWLAGRGFSRKSIEAVIRGLPFDDLEGRLRDALDG